MNLMDPQLETLATGAAPGRSIGAILIDSGRLSPESAELVLRHQKLHGKRFGDAGVELGLLTEDDVRFALSRQFEYPYLAEGDGHLDAELIAAYKPFGKAVEQLRALRSQLILRWLDNGTTRNALAVVSAGSREGRSYIAANLAIVFSQLGERTLLIDADLRVPRQHELFKLGHGPGLSDMLCGRAGNEAIVAVPSLLGLSVLPAGAVPPNPQELLGRPAFAELLQSRGRSFDVLILDTPAGDAYADALTVAARAGAALLLARKHRSSAREVAMLEQRLRQSGAMVVGSMLNEG